MSQSVPSNKRLSTPNDPRQRWSRRRWLTCHAVPLVSALIPSRWSIRPGRLIQRRDAGVSPIRAARVARHRVPVDVPTWQQLAQHGVDAARTAGAQYADVRLTRVVSHRYNMGSYGHFDQDEELLGIGIRALKDGYWGFAASAGQRADDVGRLARDAVVQATENAKGSPRIVELGAIPIATGTWATPIRIDPFTISIEDKLDHILFWKNCAEEAGAPLEWDGVTSWMQFVRQERVVATSDGSLYTQTCYESGGVITPVYTTAGGLSVTVPIHGIAVTGQGWELFLDAHIPEQIRSMSGSHLQQLIVDRQTVKGAPVGRYPLVCDGATMAALVGQTLGLATQLDRALGYEANAGGTSMLDDPIGMLGTFAVTAPLVTVRANRSAPAQLATVKWDDEGVTPEPFSLITDGVLVDFQTTREQAAWLAPYYQQRHQPVHSHGCAAAESALAITMQQIPNLVMAPSAAAVRVDDLVADVKDGILVERGGVDCDFQQRTGRLYAVMHEIKAGRVGRRLQGGAIRFSTRDLWKHLTAVGGAATQQVQSWSQYGFDQWSPQKGEPPQRTSYSVQAPAALILNQPLIAQLRKA